MADKEPLSTRLLTAEAVTPLPWAEARKLIEEARFYWLVTVNPNGSPNVRPVLAVWNDGALYSTTSPAARKGRNLAHDSRCSIAVRNDVLDVVVEGRARRVDDDSKLQQVADVYASKYGWPVTVRDSAFDAPYGAPTAWPPPYVVNEVVPVTVFGFGTDDTFGPRSTLWRF